MTRDDQHALAEAVLRNFGPCQCGEPDDHTCAGCRFLGEQDRFTNRLDRLAFVKARRFQFERAEWARICAECGREALCAPGDALCVLCRAVELGLERLE